MKKNVITIGLLLMVGTTINTVYGQSSNTTIKKDSTAVASASDRNVMLNAADNKGPREINIGLPSTVGGTTIIENGLPVVYYFWPQLPTTAWRADASIGKIGLLKMGEVAITTGDIGFAVNTKTRLGGDKLSVSGQMSTNHFGLIRATANVSGPIKDGWGYTASSIVNLDPGTYDLKFKTWEDNTQIHRLGITKKLGTKGEISLLYKYARSASFSNYGPFLYKKDGKISELDNFRLGRDSYLPSDGIVRVKELFGDKYHTKDLSSADVFTDSHTLDLLGNYQFDNNLKLKYIFRYHDARSVTQSMRPTVTSLANDDFVYADNPTEEYKGKYVQGMLAKFSERKTPVRSFTSRVELSKKTTKNSWRIGINEWYYSVDKFSDNSSSFYQEVASAPRKLIRKSSVAAGNFDPFYGYNGNIGYHNGYENKLALYATLVNKKPGTPILGHCVGGKDRTGAIYAVVLSALGVPKETIVEDYLLTGVYRQQEDDVELNFVKELNGLNDEEVELIAPAWRVYPEYINTFFKTVEEKYGSMDNYLEKECGLTPAMKAKLKDLYLEN